MTRDVKATISGTSITATVYSGPDISKLVASFETTGVSVTVNGVVQVSGQTKQDFRVTVTYTVTAEDGSTQNYTVNVSQYKRIKTSIYNGSDVLQSYNIYEYQIY